MTPKVRKAFDRWINVETWHTGHYADDHRFYAFVWTQFTFARRSLNAQAIRTEILTRWEGKFESEYLQRRAVEYSQLAETLYDFAKARTAPVPLLIDPQTGMPILPKD